jgi:hypothetical protein
VKEIELAIKPRRQHHWPELAFRVSPLVRRLREETDRVLPIDWGNELRQYVEQRLGIHYDSGL